MYRAWLLALLFFPSFSHAAALYLDPSDATYGVGDTFIVNVRLDSQNECVNAARVELAYPPESLKAVDFSKGSSIFTIWAEEPRIDTEKGIVTFSGGIPGGYCGRIPGDPVVTNIVGRVVFTVIDAERKQADISALTSSQVLLHDGLATPAALTVGKTSVTLTEERQTASNEWVDAVRSDTTPPDPFTIIVESTRDVFDGFYYIVFATVDKQSGVDHYEIYERGAWKTITSPHRLRDQSLRSLSVKAIDKAGNETMGVYIEGSAPPRQRPSYGFYSLLGLFALLIVLFVVQRTVVRVRA